MTLYSYTRKINNAIGLTAFGVANNNKRSDNFREFMQANHIEKEKKYRVGMLSFKFEQAHICWNENEFIAKDIKVTADFSYGTSKFQLEAIPLPNATNMPEAARKHKYAGDSIKKSPNTDFLGNYEHGQMFYQDWELPY